MKVKFLSLFVLAAALALTFTHYAVTQALSASDQVQYPIAELGGCESEADCKNYCNDPDHTEACLDFAVKSGLMSQQEVHVARKFLKNEIKGPGGCTSKEACENYCNDISKADECISFVEENDLLPESELREFKQVQAAIKRGVKPPPCKNKELCEAYCEDPSHMEECINFGVEAGFLEGKEREDAEKMLQAIKRGATPPPCRGRTQCQKYCSQPENMELCINFATEAGFMSEEEKENSQKMLQAIKRGVKPLTCHGKEECEAYCSQEEHQEECVTFAEAAGFLTTEEASLARKTGGKGPGGCKGKEECEAFCQDPDNQETCLSFAKEHGLMRNEEGMQRDPGDFGGERNQIPPEVLNCLEGKVGPEAAEKIRTGAMPPGEIGEQMRECFSQLHPPDQGQMPPIGPQGPSQGFPNCQTQEECEKLKMMREGNYTHPQDGPMPPPDMQGSGEFQHQYDEQERIRMEEQYRQQYQQMPTSDLQMPPSEQFNQSEPAIQPEPEFHDSEVIPEQLPPPTEIAPGDPIGFQRPKGGTLLGALVYSLFQLFFGK